MHYRALVLIPGGGDAEERVREAMAPYSEDREVEWTVDEDGGGYWHNPVGFWDYWTIGGRQTGLLDGYDPRDDPALLEVCWLCRGTGLRNDALGQQTRADNPSYTCNGCAGEGKRTSWPTQWPRHDDDVMPALAALFALREDPGRAPWSFIVHGAEKASHREEWNGDGFVRTNVYEPQAMLALIERTIRARLDAGFTDDRIAVVDYHC